MKFEKAAYSKDKKNMAFIIRKTTPSFVNALRRSIISLVPTLAIEEVQMQDNSSALYDEVVGHRLGLLPLTTPIGEYKSRKEFPDDGVARAECEIKLTLEAQGPGTVYAEQMISKDPAVICAFPKMPIVKLLKNQSIKFEATAILDNGKEHAKWSPGNAYYQYLPIVKDGSKSVEVLPKDVLDHKNQEIFVTATGELNNPDVKATNPEVTHSKEDFIFTIESWGQLAPADILSQALSQLDLQLNEITEALK